jgi:stearoyl-CoA desaturase (delta-9 desaturase)
MHFGSTSKNINIFMMLVAIFSILGLFYFQFSLINFSITLVSFYILNILGNWMMLHRYYSHRSFEFKHDSVRKFFTLLSILAGRGSPIGWVYVHRQHHAYSDTDKDPHSPKILGYYKLFRSRHREQVESEKMKIFLVKDLMNSEQLFIHKYYILFLLGFGLLVGACSIQVLYFVWILPLFFVHMSQLHFNYFGHMFGYRTYQTKDDSRNNKWLFPFVLGEAWHNNHHANPKDISTKNKPTEFDPLSFVIKFIKAD